MDCYEYIMDRIDAELNDAEGYIDHAHKHRQDRRPLADMLYQLSTQELAHEGMLKDHLAKMITASESDSWKKIWDWYHKRIAAREMAIRTKIDSYKG